MAEAAASPESFQGAPVDWKSHKNQLLGLEEACAKLKEQQTSSRLAVEQGRWEVRTDTVQVPSNSPSEDSHAHGKITVQPGLEWLYWGVFDGHRYYGSSPSAVWD